MLERTAQLHWSYDGRYYFLGNNCAVETWKLLHDGVPRLAGQGIGSITPTGLLRRLENAGIADASVLDDRAEALRLGYRFESHARALRAMFEVATAGAASCRRRRRRTGSTARATRAVARARRPARQRRCCCWSRRRSAARNCWCATISSDVSWAAMWTGVRTARRHLSPYGMSLQMEGLLSRPATLLPGTGYGLPQADEHEIAVRRKATGMRRSGGCKWHAAQRGSAVATTRNGKLRWMRPRPMSMRWASSYGDCIGKKVACSS